ncbi:hypothetical protein BpHYR1_031826 [Brachionus plicatilis]|uniref:Uncharacterized protein n=1 Tax=Brachionus plicatilis TaxID=10195 RepID=A0A3M7SXT3_BRAPC|nr:hypothetical protein BpHYR1_031826 [Brachionus plicatilis]
MSLTTSSLIGLGLLCSAFVYRFHHLELVAALGSYYLELFGPFHFHLQSSFSVFYQPFVGVPTFVIFKTKVVKY